MKSIMLTNHYAMRKILIVLFIFFTIGSVFNAKGQTFPAGFSQQVVESGFVKPTQFAFAPDGRIFVAEQTGRVRVVKNGSLLVRPFIRLTVNATGERGLLGIAFDPNYATNKFIYVYYTATTPTTHNRVSRFTADSANEDIAVAVGHGETNSTGTPARRPRSSATSRACQVG